jgi:hypothetical protein
MVLEQEGQADLVFTGCTSTRSPAAGCLTNAPISEALMSASISREAPRSSSFISSCVHIPRHTIHAQMLKP